MIYERLKELNGEIFIDGTLHEFRICGGPHAGYISITAFYRDTAVSGHRIPVDAPLDKPFRTGGHQYKVVKVEKIK